MGPLFGVSFVQEHQQDLRQSLLFLGPSRLGRLFQEPTRPADVPEPGLGQEQKQPQAQPFRCAMPTDQGLLGALDLASLQSLRLCSYLSRVTQE